MRNGILLGLMFLLPLTCFASVKPRQYLIEAKVYDGDKLVSSPRIVALDSVEAEISQTNLPKREILELQVVPQSLSLDTSNSKIALQVRFKNQHGDEIVSGSKDLVTHLGQTEILTFVSDDLSHSNKVLIRAVVR